MGSKSPSTSTVTNSPPQSVLDQYNKVVSQANQVAQTPYQSYGGELVAGLNGQQNTGISNVNASAGLAQPYMAGAAGLTLAGAGQANAQGFSGQALNQYMSPYQSQVVNATQAELQNQDNQQQQQLQGNIISSGAFGGDRAGVAQAALAGQQDLANNSTIANLNNQNYTQALGEFNNQQTTDLGAQQANLARLSGAGSQLGNIGTASQTAGLQGSAAQLQAGTLQQQVSQSQDTAAYNQFLQQQAYPFQTEQYLANISEGIGSNSGGSSTTTSPGPSVAGEAAGAGMLGLGLYNAGAFAPLLALSDRRAKENIEPVGKSFDGQTLYRFNYKGAPKTEIGLIAQNVERHHPDAVHKGLGGLRLVDYRAATDDAVSAGHRKGYDGGGGVAPYVGGGLQSWVPQIGSLPIGHGSGIPNGVSPSANANNELNLSNLAQLAQMSGMIGKKGAPSGNSAPTAPLAPSAPIIQPTMSVDSGLYARGGLVLRRRGFDDGGIVPSFVPSYAGVDASDPDATPPAALAQLAAAMNAVPAASAPAPPPVQSRSLASYQAANNAYGGDSDTDAKLAQLQPSFADHLQDLIQDAHDDYGANVGISSGYRDEATQNVLWQQALAKYGDPSIARLHVAPPGKSNHNRGFAADFSYGDPNAAGLVHSMAPAYGLNFPMGYENWHIEPDGIRGGSAPTVASGSGGGASGAADAYSARDGISGDASPAAQAIADKAVPAAGLIPATLDTPPVSSRSNSSANGASSIDAQIAASRDRMLQSGAASTPSPGLSPASQGLIAAGLGMLASRSPWAGVAIGEGGLRGLDTYQGATKVQNETADVANRALSLGLQIEQRKQQLIAGGILAGDTPTGAAPSVLTSAGATAPAGAPLISGRAAPGASVPQPGQGTVSVKGAPSVSGAPAAASLPPPGDAFWQGVPPLENPSVLNDRAQAIARYNPELAAQLMTKSQAIVSRGTVLRNGQLTPIPGYIGTAAAKSGAEAGATEAAKAPFDLVEVQPQAGGPTQLVPKSSLLSGSLQGTPVGVGAGSPPGSAVDAAAAANPIIKSQPAFYAKRQEQIATDENDMIQQYQTRQLSRQRLQALAGILQTYQPGAFAQQKADFIANLRGVGINVPDTATYNPAAFQEFVKNATANVFNDVKSMGGRVLVSEIQGLTKANANPELQPAAAAAIVGQGLGVLDYEDAHTGAYFDWKRQNPNAVDTSQFELPWAKANPVSQFVNAASKGISYQGQDVPPPEKRTSGQVYMTPRGPMIWAGNGWRSAAGSQ